jgi:hypothetical protein
MAEFSCKFEISLCASGLLIGPNNKIAREKFAGIF